MKNWKMMMFSLFFSVMTCSIAWASNRVEVKVTSEPIPKCSKMGKVGNLVLEFDGGTVLSTGDRITIDMPWGVIISQTIDIVVAPADDIRLDSNTNVYVSGSLFNENNIPYAGAGAFSGECTAGSAGGAVFHIYGTAGNRKITIDVIGPKDGSLTVESSTLSILDEKTNATGADPSGSSVWSSATVWEKGTTANLYNDAADQDDNILYIDISGEDFTSTVMNANMDSSNDKYIFIPSNPQIGHMVSGYVTGDINGDCKVGLEEAIHALRVVAGIED